MSSSSHAAVELPPGWVQVWFRMSGGPATGLGISAEALPPERVRLRRAPWAALNAAKGDIFRVRRDADGQLWAHEKLEASGFCAVRVTLAPDSPLGPPEPGVDAILDRFTALSVTGAGMFGLAVIDIAPDADLHLVRQLLDTGRRDGWWDYQELCVTEAWEAASP
ncbi:DUF4265 domain-containing protein [Micromonospora echinofusca]|uniref:DUF4265 domain-containing protein n=1 Tax=Micromonospora echinofusca TaxID=47858 RepID=A0ABS3VRN4_MICEH|nr:DUF4265 domain-containing protein [Micromonospora echinofusca]MBO4207188.1 DUF4265 domain-containing protein [Micromonospora echinofusca]